jgi:ribonuclease BN (tRNA processing enzyme)
VLDAQFAKRERPLVVAGPPSTATRVRAAMETLYPGSSQVERRFETTFVDLVEWTRAIVGPVVATAYQVIHPSGAPAYALRVEYGDKVIAYSGDTEWTDTLVDAARGADLFISEAYFFEKKIRYHLDYRTLYENRDRLECARIILTHMSDDMLARDEEIAFERAEDGTTIEL